MTTYEGAHVISAKNAVLTLALSLSVPVFGQTPTTETAPPMAAGSGAGAQKIDKDCADDAKHASCPPMAGQGLIKCLLKNQHKQRKSNPSFAYAPDCEADLTQAMEMWKAKRGH